MKADFGIVLALAYTAFVDEMRAELAAAGHVDLHRSFGYVARALTERALTVGELAAHLDMTPPGAVKIVDEMEGSDHLERVPDAGDGRRVWLRLTARGKAALAAARAFHARFEARLVAELGPRKAAACRAVLEEIMERRTRAGKAPVLRHV
jgi:DNA-binding MarR family transcriptional regulator